MDSVIRTWAQVYSTHTYSRFATGHTSSLPLEVSLSLSPGNHSSIRCSMLSTTEQRGEGVERERREGRRGKKGGDKEK